MKKVYLVKFDWILIPMELREREKPLYRVLKFRFYLSCVEEYEAITTGREGNEKRMQERERLRFSETLQTFYQIKGLLGYDFMLYNWNLRIFGCNYEVH